MRFESWVDNGSLFIKGELVEEHGDSRIGPRFQGPFDELEMVNDTVFYSFVPSSLHPDTLALACYHLFFPWIGNKVEFPNPVSPRVLELVNYPTYSRFKGEIEVLNCSDQIKPFERERGSEIDFGDIAISFGGGVDSTALHAIFPEAMLIHEVPTDNPRADVSKRGAVSSMIKFQEMSNTPYQVVKTNSRLLSKPNGVTSWLSPMIPSVLVAAENKKKSLLLGSNLGTLFLKDGLRYAPAHKIPNLARDSLAEVSVDIIQASGGISQYMATKISADSGLTSFLNFCESGENARPCCRCLKCLRRELMYRCLVNENGDAHNLSDLPMDTSTFIEKYNIDRVLTRFAPGNHEPYTHVFSFSRDTMGGNFPIELMDLCVNSPPADFMRFWPPEADEIFPLGYGKILERIKSSIPEMPRHEQAIFRSWKSINLTELDAN